MQRSTSSANGGDAITSALGRMQPVAAAAGFPVWRAVMLGSTAGFGQTRTLFTFHEKNMTAEMTLTVLDDETILLGGRALVGKIEVADALKLALENYPGFILVIVSSPTQHYKGIGTIIYASQRVGVPIQNMRLTMDDGKS